ncbi:coth protein-domain-containing protein [Radiomyces spectabilis]|uniref:coth protein-domain-containing protein n=1 Tax=Radiomyces spectabilis TaxID=64574 RepID=UPI00221FE2B7|nr:coth protein-domain-containing protein [Radiomyces spectabilis]KAI8380975.1 coth protein-domain-containing protein [Radiomyces spectabilis]
MKLRHFITSSIVTIVALTAVEAADVQYAVIAFPKNQQSVAVSVGGQQYPLQASEKHPNIFTGTAPSGETYQYVIDNHPESTHRRLAQDASSTGNEFFNRTQTVFSVPELPQAYNPIYPPLFSAMNRSNEIATMILEANQTGLHEILSNPMGAHEYTEVYKMAYITNNDVHTFSLAGIKNSGKSTKEFAKQSYKVKLNEFSKANSKELIFGRTGFKLRAHETDPTFIREKLLLDMLAASGGATLGGNFVRLYINNEPFGLYLMIDDMSTTTIDSLLHAGDADPHTGATYKGNAINPQTEGNLVYLGDNATLYNDFIYELEDKGKLSKTDLPKDQEKAPLIEFTRRLSLIDPTQARDEQSSGAIAELIDPQHTMIHLAINFLSGSWDGVWHQASNYYLNQNTQSKKWTLITYDFDETLGIGAPAYMASTPYDNFTRPGSQRPLVDAFIKSPYYRAQFEDILKTLVKRFFKPNVMEPRVKAFADMLREDVAWDLSLPAKSPGLQPTWTLWNFDNNMNATDGLSMGVTEWIRVRSQAVQQQLGFTDADDLPPLGPYTGGKEWDQNNYIAPTKKEKTNAATTTASQWSAALLGCTLVTVAMMIQWV